MACPKLKEPSDFERILAKSLCYSLGENRGVIIIEEGSVILIFMSSDGRLKVEDVTGKALGDLEEGTIVELHETIEDAITAAVLRGGRVME